ncbi:MAG: hypothetical protein DRG78_07445 [Epsilonproteobacteria bacterium]|nr:MAG: hypothetical protein DRG78_07445 [Campylobacterota bacterium]
MMIIPIKKILLEGIVNTGIPDEITQKLNALNQKGQEIKSITNQEISQINLEESLIMTKRRHHTEGAIDPSKVSKGKQFRDIDDVERGQANYNQGLNGLDANNNPMSRAKTINESTYDNELSHHDRTVGGKTKVVGQGLNTKVVTDSKRELMQGHKVLNVRQDPSSDTRRSLNQGGSRIVPRNVTDNKYK